LMIRMFTELAFTTSCNMHNVLNSRRIVLFFIVRGVDLLVTILAGCGIKIKPRNVNYL